MRHTFGMEETFNNKYVIRTKSGHPGYQSYDIIATPEDLQQLAASIQSKAQAADLPTKIHNSGVGEKLLITEYATISRGKSSRVSFSFYAAKDLSLHHRKKTHDWGFYAGCIGVLAILVLAFVGLSAILNGFWPY